MKIDRYQRLALTVGAALAGALAWPALADTQAELTARYRADRAACASGQTTESRADCLREAGAAYHDARLGKLEDGAAPLLQNQKLRCDPLKGDDRQACLERMDGRGTVSGSVASGGIYRELTTRRTGDGMPMVVEPGKSQR